MLTTPLQTHRLLLAPFAPADVDALFAFMGNAAAMQHTYVAPSVEHCLARLSTFEAMRSTWGFAPWVVRTQREGAVVGWGGLSLDPDEPEWGLEVSYAFAPGAWGQGFATELVEASLSVAFGILQAPEVHAFARPANAASARVLQKCGFTLLRYEPRLERNHYLARGACAA